MPDIESALGAREKLALSRAALLGAMGFREVEQQVGDLPAALEPTRPAKRSTLSALGLGIVGRWWARHPVNTAVQMSRPLLESYASRNPGKLLAYSAGVGSVLYLVKPWRLLSAATVVTLLFKGSDIATALTGMLGYPAISGHDESPTDRWGVNG